jgi:hypothetical protein
MQLLQQTAVKAYHKALTSMGLTAAPTGARAGRLWFTSQACCCLHTSTNMNRPCSCLLSKALPRKTLNQVFSSSDKHARPDGTDHKHRSPLEMICCHAQCSDDTSESKTFD